MQIVGPDFRLPAHAERITVLGVSGAGKTTLCTQLSSLRGLPYVEIDGLYHGENWVPRPEFLDDVKGFLAGGRWVVEWQYSVARPIITPQVQVAIWLDLPTRTAMWQLTKRTVHRWLSKDPLWNGNREPGPAKWWRRDDDNILYWGWITRNKYRDAPLSLAELGATQDLVLVRLRSRSEVRSWLAHQQQALTGENLTS